MTNADIQNVVREVGSMLADVAVDPQVSLDNLKRVLDFLKEVIEVVGDACAEAVNILVEIKYLPDDAKPDQVTELRKRTDLLLSHPHYRDVLEICGRLHELDRHDSTFMRSLAGRSNNLREWSQIFKLITVHEGAVISLLDAMVWKIQDLFYSGVTYQTFQELRQYAANQYREIIEARDALNQLNAKIQSLSDTSGFVALTATKRKNFAHDIQAIVNIYQGNYTSVGNISNSSNIAIGENAQAHMRPTDTDRDQSS